MNITVIGLGKMGVPVAKLLVRGGYSVSVWNRTPRDLASLGLNNARLAQSIPDAVSDTEVVFTMLANDEATETVMLGIGGALAALPKNAIHVALGTLSVALSKRLMAAHSLGEQGYVAAPVFGRPNVAAEGKLWVVAAGKNTALDKVRPLLITIGRGLTVVGEEPWQAHAFKLAGNMLITSMVQSLSEAFVLASANKLDPELFLTTINEALFHSPMYANYGKLMLHPAAQPGATVELGAKDTRLVREAAAESGVRLGLADFLQEQLDAAIQHNLGNVDWAVGQYRMAKLASQENS